MGDTLRGSSTAIPRIAAQKLCGFRAEFLRISSDFVKFLVTSTVQITDTQHIIVHSCIYIRTYEPYPPCSLTCDFCGKMLMATGRASPKQRVATTACTGRTRRGLDRRNLVLHVVGVGAKIGVSVCTCTVVACQQYFMHATAHLKRSCVQSASIFYYTALTSPTES